MVNLNRHRVVSLTEYYTQGNTTTFWGHETFTRGIDKPLVIKKKIGSADLVDFEDCFTIKIKNGNNDGTKRVSSAIIKVDGKVIFTTSDFSQKVDYLEKEICGLTEESEIEIELRSEVGSLINVWLDGILKPNHAKFTPEGGKISLNGDKIIIDLPPNAVSRPVYISISDLTGNMPTDYKKYELLPHGLEFNQPISLTLPYQNNPNNVQCSLEAYSQSQERIEGLKILNIDQNLKIAQLKITHFSCIILWDTPQIQLVVDIPGKYLRKGDLLYTLTYNDFDNNKFHWFPGHVGLYLGTEDPSSISNDGKKIIESVYDVHYSSMSDFINASNHLYVGARRYNGFVSVDNQNKIADYAIQQWGKPWNVFVLGNSDGSDFSCVGLTESAYDNAGLSIVPKSDEVILYPYDQFKRTIPINQITIKSGEKIELYVYGVVSSITEGYKKTADGVTIVNKPDKALWEFKIDPSLLSASYKYTWIPNQSDVGMSYDVTFNVKKNNLIGSTQESQTISFNVIQGDISSVANTTWDVTVFFNSTNSWHADVTFNADGTTKYDEPDSPGVYLRYGKWSIDNNKIHWDIGFPGFYIFDGIVTGNSMNGKFLYSGTLRNWSAIKR